MWCWNPTGTFMVHSGGSDIGTGLDTHISVKCVAEVMKVDWARSRFFSGETDNTLFDTGGLRLPAVPIFPVTQP
jgi:CO/xanthine dehydrogenase Mo-binding subunit